jgi:hypothetical protein
MAKKTRTKRPASRQMPGAPPVVEDSRLPRMGEGQPADAGQGRGQMPASPEADTGKRNRMQPMRGKAPERPGQPPARGFRPQEPRRRSRQDAKDGERYLRLRVRVVDGTLSLAGATVVDGPLTPATALHAGLAYEVTLGARRLAAGEVLDAGIWRSFPDPSGRPALSGHHVTILPGYEIPVRIPLSGLSYATLRRVNLTVYRWHGDAVETEGERSIKRRLGRRTETIGRLKGIPLQTLPKEVQAGVRDAFQRR